ncbi:uncharacterized protein [Lepeophtheirus salmonis]|uniref:uncharacterized protein n=1 Tax=Lepeophtheirus salmonis TaxID=72036 RepID=UPI001AE6AC6C|nr:uncharacterized protein LOC121131569 [Lepeophtheirus salmonis]
MRIAAVSKALAVLIWTSTSFLTVLASYRQYHMDNADICTSSRNDKIHLGTGASLFLLESPSIRIQPNEHHTASRCEIHVEAPKDYGIAVHVENMRLRQKASGACVDYIRFGQDDNVPFYTMSKSDRLCGSEPGFAYDDSKGDLLIWISLGGRKATHSWPDISVVNLTLIVTAYKINCIEPDQTQIKCKDSDRCIWNKYVCDQHFNCPGDISPADEVGCTYDGLQVTSFVKNGKLNYKLLPFTLFVLAFGLITCLSAIFLVKQRHKCCFRPSTSSGSCDLPEQTVFSLRELSNTERQTLENVYLPLNSLVQVPPTGGMHTEIGGGEGPPPAYDDLFPENIGEDTLSNGNSLSSPSP